MAKTEIGVKGMTCGGCEQRLAKALQGLEGVREATADHVGERVSVHYDPQRVSEQTLRERIAQTGYEAV